MIHKEVYGVVYGVVYDVVHGVVHGVVHDVVHGVVHDVVHGVVYVPVVDTRHLHLGFLLEMNVLVYLLMILRQGLKNLKKIQIRKQLQQERYQRKKLV